MNALRLAAVILARDALIGLVASLGWPRWPWASRAVDRCEVVAEGLRERREARE
uniref:Uncharacterized protein n=1 Tax=Desulfovibrio sp. U5L TaxID=596152 RepID=I2PZC1_9BACT